MAGVPDLADVDQTDPCAVAMALRTVMFRLIAGQAEQRVRFRNGEVEEDVSYSAANLEVLRKELATQDNACALKTTGRPRRFCGRAG